jgi:hypothetical protein
VCSSDLSDTINTLGGVSLLALLTLVISLRYFIFVFFNFVMGIRNK